MAHSRDGQFFVGFGFAPNSPITDLYERLNAALAEDCGIPRLDETNPAHVTVVPPIIGATGEDRRDAERILNEIVGRAFSRRSTALAVSGWDLADTNHGAQTLYLDVALYTGLRSLQLEVQGRFEAAFGHRLNKHEVGHPHLSIARHLSQEQAECAAIYMRSLGRIQLPASADSLGIFSWEDGRYV